jgi:uncharacterized protein YndB with AHSA1/START domain
MIVCALTAPPEDAFDAWLDPIVMHRWMASEPDREIVMIDLRPRTGGDFTIVELAGEHEHRLCGRFDAVVRPSHLELTLTDASGVSVDIVPCIAGCEVRLVPRGRDQGRWTTMLDRLARLLG